MASTFTTKPRTEPTVLPPLEAGDHLDQPTFHARYEASPKNLRAELIGGVVHMPSPLGPPHGRAHSILGGLLSQYDLLTPGVESHDNTTTILSDEDEVQPDASLVLSSSMETAATPSYIGFAPQLVAEVASSIESIDLHLKKRRYETAGVQEYLVVALRQKIVFWWELAQGRFVEMKQDEDGVFRSRVFPGLWLDARALLEMNGPRLLEVSKQGLESPEHRTFVERLKANAKLGD